MNHTKSTLALAVIAAIGLTGCGGSSSGGGGGNGDDGGDGGGNNPDSQNFQTDFSNSDRYGVTVDNGLTIDNGTLAIVTSQSASADFDGPVLHAGRQRSHTERLARRSRSERACCRRGPV